MNSSQTTIGSSTLKLADIVAVAYGRSSVVLDNEAVKLLTQRREQIENYIKSREQPAYGFNRGFGHNVDNKVDSKLLAELQRNIIRSHSSGLGELAPIPVVRAAMLLRANSLVRGYSGVRAEIIQLLVGMLNASITPAVPLFGSVGASGDLAPLSHIALTMIGEGEAFGPNSDKPGKASDLLSKAGLKPVNLEMKEGLALNNGVQFSNALGILAHDQMLKMLKTASAATALSAQVMLGSDTPFLPELHLLRPHPGAQKVAKWIWDLMQDSPLCKSHKPYEVDGEIQDPYNLRCAGQILGTCYDLISEAGKTFEIEANSVTDNPILLPESGSKNAEFTRIVSGGHFHGMPIAVKIYDLMQAMGIMARLSNMRCVRFVDEHRNKGLGSDLIWPELSADQKSTSSGMMLPEYVSAALTNAIWGEAMPSHLFSLSTDAGQEDHVSMSAGLAVRVWKTLPRLAETLAIELAFGAQAAALRKKLTAIPSKQVPYADTDPEVQKATQALNAAIEKTISNKRFTPNVKVGFSYQLSESDRALSPGCEALVKNIAETFPPVVADRELSSQLQKLSGKVFDGSILSVVEKFLC